MLNANSIVLNNIRNAILATFQSAMPPEVLGDFQASLLKQISQTDAKYILCDLSGVELIDYDEYQSLCKTLSMAALMGAKTIFVGLNPGVAAVIVDFDIDIAVFQYALNIDEGLALIRDEQEVNDGGAP